MENELFAMLSRRIPTLKEIESTVPGAPSAFVDTFLPSFFDLYPAALRAYKATGNAEILEACDKLLRTGDSSTLHELIDEVVDVEEERYQWQADGGGTWFDYDQQVNEIVEKARVENCSSVDFDSRGHSYTLDLDRMLQINRVSGTARPVRRVLI